jgi:hypothetical protein
MITSVAKNAFSSAQKMPAAQVEKIIGTLGQPNSSIAIKGGALA